MGLAYGNHLFPFSRFPANGKSRNGKAESPVFAGEIPFFPSENHTMANAYIWAGKTGKVLAQANIDIFEREKREKREMSRWRLGFTYPVFKFPISVKTGKREIGWTRRGWWGGRF